MKLSFLKMLLPLIKDKILKTQNVVAIRPR